MSTNHDLANKNFAELKDLQAEVDKAIQQAYERERVALRDTFIQMASEKGFTVEQIMGNTPKPRKSRATSAPKYRDPENSLNTWNGRGRQPLWFKKHVNSQRFSQEDMLIAA